VLNQHINAEWKAAVVYFLGILFGTFHRPGKEEFPATGLGPSSPAPASAWSARLRPLVAARYLLGSKRNDPSQ
jgi:hypothetical protein